MLFIFLNNQPTNQSTNRSFNLKSTIKDIVLCLAVPIKLYSFKTLQLVVLVNEIYEWFKQESKAVSRQMNYDNLAIFLFVYITETLDVLINIYKFN